MQIDMHYYGTYALARAAGLAPEAARTVATSAQFVDDNAAQDHVEFRDGARIDKEATAHHPFDRSNLDGHDQRRVWVPFHFIPGNEGESYTERLKCRMDSDIVRAMRDHHLTLSDRAFALELLGIGAHVHADTFSHYGFSGVSSRGNKVDNGSFRFHEEVEGGDGTVDDLVPAMRDYITGKVARFFEDNESNGFSWRNIKSWLAEEASGALGHGAVATLPDRPYLVWSFDYEEQPDAVCGMRSVRDNPATYLEGCRALHETFRRFAGLRPDFASNDGRGFEAIEARIGRIVRVQANKDGRIAAWKEAAHSGELFGTVGETIPDYEGEAWNAQWKGLNGGETYSAAFDLPVWRFYQAASLHRSYVLRDLLPKHGLIVD